MRSRLTRVLACALVAVLSGAAPALAQNHASVPSEAVFIAELVVLMSVGRLLGEAMQRLGQPTVMGQLIAGILLGPSVFGWLWPDLQHALFPDIREQKAMIDAVSQFGILLLLLLTGMETDLRLARKFGRAAISVSLAGVAVPFACGAALGAFLPASLLPGSDRRLITALFLGTALSISSIKIVTAIVREMNFMRRNLGQVIVSSAIMEDTIGWIIIAITFSLARSNEISLLGVSEVVLGTGLFLIASFTIGRRLVFYAIRWANDNFESEFPVITAILVIMGVMALVTQFIGVSTVLGAFVAGVLIGQSPILTRHIDGQLRGLIIAFFMPVFFGMAGLGTDLTILKDPRLLLMTVSLIAVASIAKFAGAFGGAAIGRLTLSEALALAFAMNARGSTEVIVATIGLSMGALTQNLFTMIVAMAVTTTMVMPVMLRWGLSRVPMSDSERERLEREETEAKGFVANLERLLLAVDRSPNGRFASRLAGVVAGARGLPITVLPLEESPGKTRPSETRDHTAKRQEKGAAVKHTVTTAAEDSKRMRRGEDETAPADITVQEVDAVGGEAIAQEARKGYDLLFIGVERTYDTIGGFHADAARIAASFDGPQAIVAANGIHLRNPEAGQLHVLVPVDGTAVSRRAAELGITVARVLGAPITALYVSNSKLSKRAKSRHTRRPYRHEQAILKDVVELAGKYEQRIETIMHSDMAPDEAILAEARRRGSHLIIMGVTRRAGEELFFGDTAAAVLEGTPISVVLLSS